MNKFVLFFAIVAVIFVGCSKDDDSIPPPDPGTEAIPPPDLTKGFSPVRVSSYGVAVSDSLGKKNTNVPVDSLIIDETVSKSETEE
jgi:hypothetical protein